MHAIAVWGAIKHALNAMSATAAAELRLPATGEEILRCLSGTPTQTRVQSIALRAVARPENGAPTSHQTLPQILTPEP
jgi:hypothetical protein